MDDYEKSFWSNGSYTIEWINSDEILIKGPYGRECVIDGGDFETFLCALCSVKNRMTTPEIEEE